MPSGTHLTLEDRYRILQLVGRKNDDGEWRLCYSQVAKLLGLHPDTVSEVVRDAAVKWGEQHKWQ